MTYWRAVRIDAIAVIGKLGTNEKKRIIFRANSQWYRQLMQPRKYFFHLQYDLAITLIRRSYHKKWMCLIDILLFYECVISINFRCPNTDMHLIRKSRDYVYKNFSTKFNYIHLNFVVINSHSQRGILLLILSYAMYLFTEWEQKFHIS